MSFMLWCHWVSAAVSLNLNIFRYSTMQIVIVVVSAHFSLLRFGSFVRWRKILYFYHHLLPLALYPWHLHIFPTAISHRFPIWTVDLHFFNIRRKKLALWCWHALLVGVLQRPPEIDTQSFWMRTMMTSAKLIKEPIAPGNRNFLSNSLRQIKKHRRVKNWLN